MQLPKSKDVFFRSLDIENPALIEIRKAVEQNDWKAAELALAVHVRSRKRPTWLFNWRDRSDSLAEIDNVDMDLANKITRNTLEIFGREYDFGEEIDWFGKKFEIAELENLTVRLKWSRRLSRHAFWITLGHAFWKTEDERYTEAFVKQLTHWIENVCEPCIEREEDCAQVEDGWCWLPTDCCNRLVWTWLPAFFYFLSSEKFTPEVMCLMLESILSQVSVVQNSMPGTSATLKEASALYTVSIMFPEFKEAATWRVLALDRITRVLQTQIYPDGSPVWLSSDFPLQTQVILPTLLLGRLNFQELPNDYLEKLESMYEYFLCITMPNQCMPALNDRDQTDMIPTLQRASMFFLHRKDFKWVCTQGKDGIQPKWTSRSFRYAGHFVMRSGWEAEESYLLFDGGPLGYGNGHEDKLSIVVYSQGKVHLLDLGGRLNNFDPNGEMALTRSHNTVIIDGKGQNRRYDPVTHQGVSVPLPHIWISEADFDFVSASYCDGYGLESELEIVHTRSVLYIKPEIWIITDFLKPVDDVSHTYEALFHLNSERVTLLKERSLETRDTHKSNFGIYGLCPQDMNLDFVSYEEESGLEGANLLTAIFRTIGTGTKVMSYVLSSIRESERSPIKCVKPIPQQESYTPIAGQIDMWDGNRIYFAHRKKTSENIELGRYTTDAEAMAIVVDSKEIIVQLILVDGRDLRSNGRRIQVGDFFEVGCET